MSAELAPYNAMYGLCATIFLLVFGYRLRGLIRAPRDNPAAAVVAAAFASTGIAFLFAAPAVYVRFGTATGSPNAATPVVYLGILTTSALFQVVLVLWSGPARDGTGVGTRPRVAAWAVGYLGLVVTLLVLFAAGDTGGAEHPIDFDAHYADRGLIAAFLLLYYAGFATAMAAMARLCRRYASIAGPAWVVRGMGWVWVGALFALGYCLLKVVAVVGIMAGGPLQELSTVWAPLSASIGALLIGAGLTAPVWGPRLTGTGRSLARRRACGRLYPLWRAMSEAEPAIGFDPRPRRWPIRNLDHALYRRVIEILDGRLALSRYLDPDPAAVRPPTGSGGRRRPAAAREAAMLIAALQAKRDGATPIPAAARSGVAPVPPLVTPAVAPPEATPAVAPGGHDLGEELRWLLLVSQEYRRQRRPGLTSRIRPRR